MSQILDGGEIIHDISHVNVVIMGHAGSGKSTATGNMIYLCGGIEEGAIKKCEKEAKEMGRGINSIFYKYSQY